MFEFFRKHTKTDFEEIQKFLFGDVSLSEWKTVDKKADMIEPWSSFEAVRLAVARGDTSGAVNLLRRVAAVPELESRQYLQAWHFLREFGVQPPPDEAKRVRGVVLEICLSAGLDTLAAYSDHTARYINHGGRLIVWEESESEMNSHIDELLRAGQRIADAIGPWDKERRTAPPKGHVRINMLTALGLHFGEGPFGVLSADPMGAPVILAGTQLMKALIERAEAAKA